MLALTEYGLRLVVAESEIGRLPIPTPPCFKTTPALNFVHMLRSRSCRESLENSYPSNENPQISCREASRRLEEMLKLPKCSGWTDEEYQQGRRRVAQELLQDPPANMEDSLRALAQQILSGGESPPQPSPQEDLWEKIKEFLQKYGIYIAVGLVVLFMLGGRRR